MIKRNWKRARPNSLRHAMELCLEHAKEKHNRSVDQVADLMGQASKWTLYKWLESGRMPSNLIRPFEHACDAHYMTWWIAHGAHKLLIDIPKGAVATPLELATFQATFADVTGQLIRFYDGKADAAETIGQLTAVMSELAWHRQNVALQAAPELDLFSEDGSHE